MNLLATLRQHNIPFQKGSEDWIRLECPQCRKNGRKFQDRTLSLHSRVPYVGNCWRCGEKYANQKEIFAALSLSVLQEDELLSIQIPKQKSFSQPIPQESFPAWDNPQARAYLQSRHLTYQEADRYAIHYCSDGYFSQRLIFPIFNHRREYCTFVSRHIGQYLPKYKYPKGCQISHFLYNLLFYYGRQQSLVLVEGIFDSFHVPNSVALFGKTISQAQISLLRMGGFQTLFMLLDAEARQNTPEICEQNLQRLSQYFITYEIRLEHSTPTEYTVEEIEDMKYAVQIG